MTWCPPLVRVYGEAICNAVSFDTSPLLIATRHIITFSCSGYTHPASVSTLQPSSVWKSTESVDLLQWLGAPVQR